MKFFNAIVKIFLAIILCGNISFADDFLRQVLIRVQILPQNREILEG